MIPKVPLFYFIVYEVYFHRMLHLGVCPNFIYLILYFTWIIHGSSLPQMRGTGYAAVVLHRKCPVTKQML